MRASQSIIHRKSLKALRQERRASTSLMLCMLFPVLVGLAALGCDGIRLNFMHLKVAQTSEATVVAAASNLLSYYTGTTQTTTAIPAPAWTAANTIAQANAPTSPYGTVVPYSSVSLGNWDTTARIFTALSGAGPFAPNAVRATGLLTTANSNPVVTMFGAMLGVSTVDISKASVAVWGTQLPFNVIMVNDTSPSFSSYNANEQTGDQAILDCVAAGNPNSLYGITRFDANGATYQAPQTASTNYAALTTAIGRLNPCSMPGFCSKSNVAAGLYAAIQQYQATWRGTTTAAVGSNENLWTTPPPSTTANHIIIITDTQPQPDGSRTSYTLADGVTINGSTASCTSACTPADLSAAAQYQAGVAVGLGMIVSTLYYVQPGSTASQITADQAFLATLKGSAGVALVTPSTGTISTYIAGACSLMGVRLVM